MTKRRAHYTVRMGDQICEQIAQGKTLQQALDYVGFLGPSIVTAFRWLDIYPDFREKYERARQLQADVHADRMLEMSHEVIENPRAATAYRVALNVLQWQAEVRNRNRYGKSIDESGKNKPLDPAKLRAEIKRLEAELGVVESIDKNKVKALKVVK